MRNYGSKNILGFYHCGDEGCPSCNLVTKSLAEYASQEILKRGKYTVFKEVEPLSSYIRYPNKILKNGIIHNND